MSQVEQRAATGAVSPEQPAENSADAEQRILSIYRTMLSCLFISTLVFCLAIGALILIPYKVSSGSQPSIALTVVLVGALGAFFSALIRLYDFEDLPKIFVTRSLQDINARYLFIYSVVPAIVGAISAVVLYLIFAGKIVAGPLFPEFVCKSSTQPDCNSFLEFVDNLGPKAGADYAKVLVWAFVAGFAERLVPDTLQTLTQNLKEASTRKIE